jgi:hypothetical protein
VHSSSGEREARLNIKMTRKIRERNWNRLREVNGRNGL